MTSRTILVFGEQGQVARELADLPPRADLTFQFAGRARCDLTTEDPAALIRSSSAVGVINASAYTAVDKAESEPDLAFRLNRDAVGAMARACAEAGLPFVHFSTDYVFDGRKTAPYVETDPRGPLGLYGRSKAEGEDAVAAAGGACTVFRTAWVVSGHGANFIRTMKRLASERGEISVVDDQHGRPTWAADAARVAVMAIERHLAGDSSVQGVFHLAGADDATWADVAAAVFEDQQARHGKATRLKRITTAEYPTPAARPANSRLDTTKLQAALDWRPRPWRETVTACLDALEAGAAK
jgi:dTDP-4-dehydrorhamnose reductase